MSFFLENGNLKLEITAPGEMYRGERFDWNGSVIQMYYKGLPLLGMETGEKEFDTEINARGLYGEFGIKNCIGYEDIEVGEYFPKIGTGWLKKNNHPYSFANRYERKPLNFSYSTNPEEKYAVFNCNSGDEMGYSYFYSKKITINADGFTESYSFSNTGSKLIETTHYVHNFFKPGKENIGPHISIEFPSDFDYSILLENVRTLGVLENQKGKLNFLKEPETDYFFGGIWTALNDCTLKENDPSWVLKDRLHGIQVSETDSFEPWNADLWGYKKNVSPEIFYYLKAAPGETVKWSRTYKISENKKLKDKS